jgi:4-alpha-glucanotransferase
MKTSDAPNLTQTIFSDHWQRVGIRHHHGIIVPLFSLWSRESCGIGEFPDLFALIDWCYDIGFDVIQLLPLNDPGDDSSPYNAISSCALNPLHLGLSTLSRYADDPKLCKMIASMQGAKTGSHIDWVQVRISKNKFLQRYKKLHFERIAQTDDYQAFLAENRWLTPYAEFKSLKTRYNGMAWKEWPAGREPPDLEEVDLHKFIQYLCHKQLEAVREHAEKKGVFLKGDLPILISPDSADVWHQPSLFDLTQCAGAPPDVYSEEGQKWGFPLYNWDRMAAEEYCWWKQRLDVASRYYHLYRIDHIVGFFRIWAIALDKDAREGHFEPHEPSKWIPQGERLLKMMCENSPMLPIGEDLGNVPEEVRDSLSKMGIAGTKVMRWERKWDEDRRFVKESHYPSTSMTTISTHDSETLKQWWEELLEESKFFAEQNEWNHTPVLTDVQRFSILYKSHNSSSLFHINLLQEYLALQPDFQMENSSDERVNIPGQVLSTNWSCRTREPIEVICAAPSLKRLMRCLRGPFSA